LGRFLLITTAAQKFGQLYPTEKLCIVFDKKQVKFYIVGEFFRQPHLVTLKGVYVHKVAWSFCLSPDDDDKAQQNATYVRADRGCQIYLETIHQKRW
jgi:hypothetical protein